MSPMPKTRSELRSLLRNMSANELAAVITRTNAIVLSGELDAPEFDRDLQMWATELLDEVERRKMAGGAGQSVM